MGIRDEIEVIIGGILINGKRYFIVVTPVPKKGKHTVIAYDKETGNSVATADIKVKDIKNIEAIIKTQQELIRKIKGENK